MFSKTVFYSVVVTLSVLIALAIAAIVFYLSPLRNVNIVPPIVENIEPTEFYEQFQNNPDDFVFVDVRPGTVYEKEHAEGSRNIPLHKLYTEKNYLPKDKTIVLICTGGSASGVAYGYLEHHGFLDLKRIAGGVNAWKSVGLPTESSL